MAVKVETIISKKWHYGESGTFAVVVRNSGKLALLFDAEFDHNGVRVSGPRGMASQVHESMRGWGEGVPEAGAKLAEAAYRGWLDQFGAAPVEVAAVEAPAETAEVS